jgi:hypothetical protein
MKNFRLLGAIASGLTFYWEALVFSLFNKSLVHVRLTPWGLIRLHFIKLQKKLLTSVYHSHRSQAIFFRRSSVFYLLNKKSWMYSNSPLQINTIIIFPEMPLKYLIVFHELYKMMKNFRLLGAIASGRTFYWEALVFSLFNKSIVHVRLTPWGLIRLHFLEAHKMITDFNLLFTPVSGNFFYWEVQFLFVE